MISGAVCSALAVILGAFGAHALKPLLDASQMRSYETAVMYQFYHSFALLIAGIAYYILPVKALKIAAALFVTGIILFSGSLYLITLLKFNGDVGLRGIGIITPIGGVCFILGWVSFIIALIQKK